MDNGRDQTKNGRKPFTQNQRSNTNSRSSGQQKNTGPRQKQNAHPRSTSTNTQANIPLGRSSNSGGLGPRQKQNDHPRSTSTNTHANIPLGRSSNSNAMARLNRIRGSDLDNLTKCLDADRPKSTSTNTQANIPLGRSSNSGGLGPRQKQNDHPRSTSTNTYANIPLGRSSNSKAKARLNRMRNSDLANLTKCLDEEPEELILKLLRRSSWFSKLVQSTSSLSPNCIVLIVRLLAKMSDCSFTTNTIEILKIVSTDVFLLQLNSFIMLLPHQKEEEREEACYFWNDANSFFQNLSKYFEIVLSLSPSTALDILPKLMQAIFATIPHLNILLEETKQLFEIIKEKLNICKEEINLQRKMKNMAIDDDLEPPDDFRLISLYPLPTEITDRKKAFVRPNIIEGSYRDVDHYLDVQFRLLREDFVKPLREGICDYMDGNHRLQNIRVYKNVKLLRPAIGPTNGTFGVLVQLEIKDGEKYRLKIETSRSFMFGSLVCFTRNNFNSLIFGKIICRDLPLLTKGQLIIEFEEGNSNIEYNVNCTMVESSVYFEPYYHVLKVLQSLHDSTFPMKEYIVNVNKEIEPPRYPTGGFSNFHLRDYLNPLSRDAIIRIKREHISSEPLQVAINKLNETQSQALQSALTNCLSIIQGPPGTGKTHLGLIIARSLLQKKSTWNHGCYPLLVVCFTNHALDQFLEGLLGTTTEIVRIGGQSKNKNLDNFNIKERRRDYIKSRSPAFSEARDEMSEMHRDLKVLYNYIKVANEFRGVVNILGTLEKLPELQGTWFENITPVEFRNWLFQGQAYFQRRPIQQFKQAQLDNLYEEDDGEVFANIVDDTNAQRYLDLDNIFTINMGKSSFSSYIISLGELHTEIRSLYLKKKTLETLGEANFNEYLKVEHVIATLENTRDYSEENDELSNEIWSLYLKKTTLQTFSEENFNEYLKVEHEIATLENARDYLKIRMAEGNSNTEFQLTTSIDLFNPMKIHPNDRWNLYFYWLGISKTEKMEEIAELENQYRTYYKKYEELRAIEDLRIMRKQLVVGMTTTSAARLQESLRALRSPLVIVEEAAEIMESHVIASLTKHCGHLILIGDHQQLRPNTADYTMEKKFKLGISLFERLIMNEMPCNVLNVQHRMRPEIAKLVSPNIYPNLQNHESVYKFPSVLGVRSSLFFITHSNVEERCMGESKSNLYEAEFLLHLAKYLLLNGYKSEDITILAAYSGQMFLMHRERRRFDILKDVRITVLDNYQGEESKIILLSLVRNNDEGKIGFLSIENRICVALSRARQGLFIMGNMDMLSSNNNLWKRIRTVLEEQDSLGISLPLKCQNHPDKETYITNTDDFSKVPEGGCDQICNKLLECGHSCKWYCHIIDANHESYECKEKCTKILCDNGHVCTKLCYDQCGQCMVLVPRKLECGHEMKYPCSQIELNCQYPVSAELPCNHKVDDKPCYIDVKSYRCPFPCGTKLNKCSHICSLRCHINIDPDHLMYKCYEVCTKYARNCTEKTEKHICPELCYEDCPDCPIEIRKERSCSHFFDVLCSTNVESDICTKPCKKTLSCGHPCPLKCNEVCGCCTEKVEKRIPECNHDILIECSKTPTRSQCRNNCPKILPCGHGCKEKCSEKCTLCTELVDSNDSLLCGHHSKIPCYMNNTDFLKQPNMLVHCKQPCSAILECGHVCSGSCRECFQGRLHKICQQKCDVELICGHKCTLLCNQPCQPCVLQPCMRKCPHQKYNGCGSRYMRCRNSCSRRCEHVRCPNFCDLKCSVPPCEEPCRKTLACAHQCIGFCGEPCPPLCIKCNKDELFTFSMGDNEEDARFVLLQECNHVVESKGMNSWLETDKVGVKKCPVCLIPLSITRRFNNHIQDSIVDVQKAKNVFFGENTENRSLQDSLYVRVENNCVNNEIFRRVSKMYENICSQIKRNLRKEQTMTNILGKILTSKIQILEDITKLFNNYLSERKTSKCIEYIDLLLQRLMQNENRMTDQEVIDYTMEIKRLRRMLQLDDFEQIYPSLLQEDLFKSLNEKLYSYSRYNADDDVIVGEDLKKLCKAIGGDISMLKDVDLQEIVKAVGIKYGNWYIRKCSNGHKYATENFSETITASDCKTCTLAAIRITKSRLAI